MSRGQSRGLHLLTVFLCRCTVSSRKVLWVFYSPLDPQCLARSKHSLKFYRVKEQTDNSADLRLQHACLSLASSLADPRSSQSLSLVITLNRPEGHLSLALRPPLSREPRGPHAAVIDRVSSDWQAQLGAALKVPPCNRDKWAMTQMTPIPRDSKHQRAKACCG